MDEPGGGAQPAERATPSTEEPRTRGFLFCDLRGYTAFVEAHGDRAGAALLEQYRSIVRGAVARAAGAEIRTEGDSFYVVFPSASPAVLCGLDIVEAARASSDAPGHEPIHAGTGIQVGVGIHAGESVEQADGYVGSAVNIAARVCSEARAGEVLVTDIVRGLVRTRLDVTFIPRGAPRLKGIAEPIHVFQVTSGEQVLAAVRPGRRSFIGVSVVALAALVLVGAVIVARPWESAGTASITSPSPGTSAGASVTASAETTLPGRLAFVASQVIGSDSEPRWQLWVVDAAGGDWQRMTELTDVVNLATWSPDGRQLLYNVRGVEDLPPRIVTVATAPASTLRPWPSESDVVEWEGVTYTLGTADWSPSDEIIIEGVDPTNDRSRIFAVSADGSSVRLVTEPALGAYRTWTDRYPTISPDAATVVFYGGYSPETTDVWAAGSDGTGRIQITDAVIPFVDETIGQAGTGTAWSPDGLRLVLAGRSAPGEQVDLWSVKIQGTNLHRLTEDVAIDDRPAWSPDGRWVAWTRVVSGQRQIWVMTAEGADPRALVVGDEGEDLYLVGWAPGPE